MQPLLWQQHLQPAYTNQRMDHPANLSARAAAIPQGEGLAVDRRGFHVQLYSALYRTLLAPLDESQEAMGMGNDEEEARAASKAAGKPASRTAEGGAGVAAAEVEAGQVSLRGRSSLCSGSREGRAGGPVALSGCPACRWVPLPARPDLPGISTKGSTLLQARAVTPPP